MLTREQRLRLRLETGAAAGLPGPAGPTVIRRAGRQRPCPAGGTAEHRLALLRAEYARLISAARASVTAGRAGAAHPLAHVEAELARHGGLPPRDATVPAVLADAASAMVVAGRATEPGEAMRAA